MRKFDMPERIRPIEQMLELNEDAMSPEHLDSQVQKAQEQLLQLKRQQDQIEKQKRELEELSRRQEELERGRTEMLDKLTRSLVVLEREAYDTQKKLEQIRATRESFGQHLELIEAIDPKSWNPADLHKELSRSLSAVDDARAEFSQQRSRLQATDEAQADVAVPEELTRQQREELLLRAGRERSRLDVSLALHDKRYGDDGVEGAPRRPLRKERRDGRIVFLLLVIALLAAVIWLVAHFHGF